MQIQLQSRKITSTRVIERCSTAKMKLLVTVLLIVQGVSLLTGCFTGELSNYHSDRQIIPATACVGKLEDFLNQDGVPWFEPSNCTNLEFAGPGAGRWTNFSQVVYAAILPMVGRNLSRWQQNLFGALQINISTNHKMHSSHKELFLMAKLGYSDTLSDGGRTSWKLYDKAIEIAGERSTNCSLNGVTINNNTVIRYAYSCTVVPLFELLSAFHDYYLLNMRLYETTTIILETCNNYYSTLDDVSDVYLQTEHVNERVTVSLAFWKTAFFFCAVFLLRWYNRKMAQSSTNKTPFNTSIFCLGLALVVLNTPYQFLALCIDMNVISPPLINNVLEMMFFVMLLNFWRCFIREHIWSRNSTMMFTADYEKNFSCLVFCCLLLTLSNSLYLAVLGLISPFCSIWTYISELFTIGLMAFTSLCAVSYFSILLYMSCFCFRCCRTRFPRNISHPLKIYYETLRFRYCAVTLITILCAGCTLSYIVSSQVVQICKWTRRVAWISAAIQIPPWCVTAVFGLWNVYAFMIMILYTPCKPKPITEILNRIQLEISTRNRDETVNESIETERYQIRLYEFNSLV